MAYLAEQRITTVGGRAGALTGDADLQGNPYVQFDSGALYSVPREAIPGVLVHKFGSTGEAYDYSQASDAILDGDVLFVPEEGIAAVLYRAWPVAVNEPHDVQHGAFHGFDGGPDALAADDGGRYAESVRRARDLIGASAAPADTRPANDRAPQEARMASPAGMPAVTAAIQEINDRLGYPRSRPNPCPAHMVHDYMPIDGITVTGDPYSGDRTQRLHIAGAEVGVVGTAPVTGSSATCLLPHQPSPPPRGGSTPLSRNKKEEKKNPRPPPPTSANSPSPIHLPTAPQTPDRYGGHPPARQRAHCPQRRLLQLAELPGEAGRA